MSKAPKSKQPNQIVEIKVVTWNKDSHGLFDYQSKTLSQKKFIVQQTSSIFRNNQNSEVIVLTSQQLKKDKEIQANHTHLTEIIKKQNTPIENRYCFNIESEVSNPVVENKQDVYLIVRSLKNRQGVQKGYPLYIGDIIKLGRIEYLISEIKTQTFTLSTKKTDFDIDINKVYQVTEKLTGLCKICLVQQQWQDNFFVAPCKCKGSCQIVHINCLKKWIQSKIKVKQHMIAISYNFTKFECEICKDPYPKMIKKDQIDYELFVIQRPTTPYIMIESLQNQSRGNKTMYLISASGNDPIKLGRGHQCEIRITDISVSREHAHIKYENGSFIISDNNSKFGTLIKMQNNLVIKNEKVAIQIGRTVITCVLKNEDVKEKTGVKNINVLSNQYLGAKK